MKILLVTSSQFRDIFQRTAVADRLVLSMPTPNLMLQAENTLLLVGEEVKSASIQERIFQEALTDKLWSELLRKTNYTEMKGAVHG